MNITQLMETPHFSVERRSFDNRADINVKDNRGRNLLEILSEERLDEIDKQNIQNILNSFGLK
ncbi:hypothetical protein COX98_01420 [Candidatus Pacearchaeota archaeon CG_4_10_14_0_2_um_filter_30_11]|nr:MAG: hypothetical protein COX98_01420 [Candidatus Pacearchaeota archaeon CG_4_10_14_0_2_um_filter_30_11]